MERELLTNASVLMEFPIRFFDVPLDTCSSAVRFLDSDPDGSVRWGGERERERERSSLWLYQVARHTHRPRSQCFKQVHHSFPLSLCGSGGFVDRRIQRS